MVSMLLSASLCDNNQMLCCADYSVEIIASCGFCIVSVFDDQAFTCSSMLR